MDPKSVTIGARLGRKLNLVILAASAPAPDRVAFFGGMIATIVGAIAAAVGPQTAAELLRNVIGSLEKQPQLELPAGVRLAMASVDTPGDSANDAPPAEDLVGALHLANSEQLEAMRRVLTVVSAKAEIPADELIGLLNTALEDVRAGIPPRPIETPA